MERLHWFWQDLRYGLRSLRKDRGFASLAVVALALGIGATTVIFSVLDNVLLEPFPYKNPDRLAMFFIHDNSRADREGRGDFSVAEYMDFKEQNHIWEGLIANNGKDILYTDKDGTKQYHGGEVTGDTFGFLGMQPLLGRGLVPDDARPGAAPVAVMSYRIWQKDFNGDPKIVNSTLELNGKQVTLVGIMPPRFLFGAEDFWLPMTIDRGDTSPFNRVWLLGRLKPGVTLKAAASDLDVVARRLSTVYRKDYPKSFSIKVMSLADQVVGQFRVMLFALMAAVSMLLLIACSNVANLLLARATAREKEIAIRASMGATRTRLVLQLMVESFILAGIGCLAGCLFAYGGIKGVLAALPPDLIPAETVIKLNVRLLLFSLGVTVITTLLCGLAPAFHSVRGELHNRLKDTGKGTQTVFRHGRFRSGLVVSQVALSIVLLVGAGLMMRSLFALQHVDLGLTPDHILVARTPLPKGRYEKAEQKRIFFRQVLQKVTALPGVVAATETSTLPPYGGIPSDVTVPGKTHAETWRSIFQLCSEGYFPTLGIRLVRGRLLTESDVESARHVIVVNQTLARSFFGTEDPIAKSIKFNLLDTVPESPRDAYFEIIGVVSDVKNRGLQEAPQPEAFMPYSVSGAFERGVLVRTAVEPMSMLLNVRREIWSVDRGVALTLTGTLEGYLEQFSYSQPRFGLILFGVFAGIGLALVAIGVFSVMAYSVSLQTHEIGIRMALGAQQGTVLRMILRKGLLIIALGILVGEAVSLGVTRLIQSQIWGVSAHDPLTFAAVLAVLIVVGISACLIPARRATRVDPLVALRYE
ncbi:MAG TPA: ABC transporter permease [Terriglobales bacterium]|nr:ABC transporter permease [Terriglobales bacterium]